MNYPGTHIFNNSGISVLTIIIWLLCFTFSRTLIARPFTPIINENEAVKEQADTVSVNPFLKEKLNDPAYDVRYQRGRLRPWHDFDSPYLRRTIPVSNLACLKSNAPEK